jgi:hypothetical protein
MDADCIIKITRDLYKGMGIRVVEFLCGGQWCLLQAATGGALGISISLAPAPWSEVTPTGEAVFGGLGLNRVGHEIHS